MGKVEPALLRDLRQSMARGKLQHSDIGRIVRAELEDEADLEMACDYDRSWIITGIQLSDEYFARVRKSAGQRDWQHDFAQTAEPVLIAMAQSLQQSPDAQALIMRLCDLVAGRLRLRLIWPQDPHELNDLKNAIYRACLDATSLECHYVLAELKAVTVVGPE